MSAKRIVTIAVVSMLLIGGVAAIGAASPADQANQNGSDAYAENASADAENGSDARADGDDAAAERDGNADRAPENGSEASEESDAANASDDRSGSVGPSDGLPEQVPDHVSQIHETIESFLSGEVENLGEALRSLTPGEEPADAGDAESSEDTDAQDDA